MVLFGARAHRDGEGPPLAIHEFSDKDNHRVSEPRATSRLSYFWSRQKCLAARCAAKAAVTKKLCRGETASERERCALLMVIDRGARSAPSAHIYINERARRGQSSRGVIHPCQRPGVWEGLLFPGFTVVGRARAARRSHRRELRLEGAPSCTLRGAAGAPPSGGIRRRRGFEDDDWCRHLDMLQRAEVTQRSESSRFRRQRPPARLRPARPPARPPALLPRVAPPPRLPRVCRAPSPARSPAAATRG
jgi:hypothetical protein